jgi:hypothetical protein
MIAPSGFSAADEPGHQTRRRGGMDRDHEMRGAVDCSKTEQDTSYRYTALCAPKSVSKLALSECVARFCELRRRDIHTDDDCGRKVAQPALQQPFTASCPMEWVARNDDLVNWRSCCGTA